MGRHVDLWTAVTAVHSRGIPAETDEAPVPEGDEGLERRSGCGYRQRIDMISPATMAPKPTAKFHDPSDCMTGIWSPAT